MKRILAALLILMMVVTCVSCKKDEGSDTLSGLHGSPGYEDQPDEQPDTNSPDVNDEEQGGNNETPSTDTPTNTDPDQKDETQKPSEDNSSDQTEETPEDEEPGQEEEKPSDDKEEPQPEQKPGEEENNSPYPGEAVTFFAAESKIPQNGSYSDLRDLKLQTVGGETLFLLSASDELEQFDVQISSWMETGTPEDEEEEDDYEEVLLFSLQDELGRDYGSSFFDAKSLLVLCVSGGIGDMKAVMVENGQLNLYIEKAADSGAGVLVDLSTSVVAVEVPTASIADCTAYKINMI